MNVYRGYDFFEHTGDIGISVYGKTHRDLFQNAFRALFAILTKPEQIKPSQKKMISVKNEGWERLLVSWLSEYLYLFETGHWLFRTCEIQSLDENRVQAVGWGEKFDPERHEINTEIKAVTYHQLSIQKKNDLWETKIILDI
jgi:SHS2 domain-containing protein